MDVRKELYKRVMDAELRITEDRIYTALLMTLGLLSIVAVATHLLFNEFYAQREHAAFFVIGCLLFFSGWAWQTKNQKKLTSANEDYEDLGNIEEEGRRIHTFN
jgi:drug/metabolite transporter (DMT)-like permease